MRLIFRYRGCLRVVLLMLVLTTAMSASIIVQRTGTTDPLFGWAFGGVSPNDAVLAVSWYQPFVSTNTQIDVFGIESVGALSATFYLTQTPDDLPPATAPVCDVDGVICSGLTSADSAVWASATLFGGQSNPPLTLAAGTWFLLVKAPGSSATWYYDLFGAVETQNFGASLGGEYFGTDDSGTWTGGGLQNLDVGYQVLADSPVPEPATYLFLGGGLIGLAMIRRRRSA